MKSTLFKYFSLVVSFGAASIQPAYGGIQRNLSVLSRDLSLVSAVSLEDVTARWTFRDEVISAFPATVARVPREENWRIIKVFSYFQGDAANPQNERRVEVMYTGGDWMEYGIVYFIANSPNAAAEVSFYESAAYKMSDLSTTDLEDGAVAPAVDPLNDEALRTYISTKFLDANGAVAAGFAPISD